MPRTDTLFTRYKTSLRPVKDYPRTINIHWDTRGVSFGRRHAIKIGETLVRDIREGTELVSHVLLPPLKNFKNETNKGWYMCTFPPIKWKTRRNGSYPSRWFSGHRNRIVHVRWRKCIEQIQVQGTILRFFHTTRLQRYEPNQRQNWHNTLVINR